MKITKLWRHVSLAVCASGMLVPSVVCLTNQTSNKLNANHLVQEDPNSIQIIPHDANGPMAIYQEAGSYQYTIVTNPLGAEASATWQLVNADGSNNISITQNGLLEWNEYLKAEQTYHFSIKATSTIIPSISDEITVSLYVDYHQPSSIEVLPISFNNVIQGFNDADGVMENPLNVNVLPVNANQSYDLAISSNDAKTQALIDNQQIYLHDQKLHWLKGLELGNYPIHLSASVFNRPDINSSLDFVLEIIKNEIPQPKNHFEASSLTSILIIIPTTIILLAITIVLVLKIRSKKDYEAV